MFVYIYDQYRSKQEEKKKKKEKGGPQCQGVEMRNERGGGGGSGPNATVLELQAAEMESGLLAFERWAGPFSHKSHANMYSESIQRVFVVLLLV